MTELDKFYKSLNSEIFTRQLSEENGATQEQVFTQICLDMLSEAKETENAVLAYDEKALGTRNQHKVNAYAISLSSNTLDLFITIFSPSDEIEAIDKQSVERACTRVGNFLTKCLFGKYENEIAETSAVFELAHQLGNSKELREKLIRINRYILTNKKYKGEIPIAKEFNSYTLFTNVIDLEKLYSISMNSRLPIHLDLEEQGLNIPCLSIPTGIEEYDAYLTYLPGNFLSFLYKQYGFKLLEQNVRSFLQFKGGINRGIRDTVLKSPNMFFAYNNGISATADSIVLDETKTKILAINNLQIVNGGQTTATLFHVSKDAGENISKVLVPMKLSVIHEKGNTFEIIKHISKFANTQNKINDADLSANDPVLVEIEKISRYMLTPITISSAHQYYWFFDRISRQYDNLMAQSSRTKSGKKAFLLKYPKSCKFTKYELAKYYNSYFELIENGKILVGPHCVVDGNEVNFRAFRDIVMPSLEIDKIFYEDLIAKAILFKEVDRLHGTKRSKTPPIGDMKQVMVPYSIALLKIATNNCLDLGKIWRNQKISNELSDYMYTLMIRLNKFLIEKSPRTNIIEWATKEECWKFVKEEFVIPDITIIANDVASHAIIEERYSKQNLSNHEYFGASTSLITAIPNNIWLKIAEWGKDSGCLSLQDQNFSKNIAHKQKYGYKLCESEIYNAIDIYTIVKLNNPELFIELEEMPSDKLNNFDANMITNMLAWEKSPIILENWQFKILQKSIKLSSISKFQMYELLFLASILNQHGFENHTI